MSWWRTAAAGDKIVCIDALPHRGYMPLGLKPCGDLDGLRGGVVYTVRRIAPFPRHPETMTVVLEEIERSLNLDLSGLDYYSPGFAVGRFRPARTCRADISVFQKMLRPQHVEAA